MSAGNDPGMTFSDDAQTAIIDGRDWDVEIFRTRDDPGWILSVENEPATLTVSDNPPYRSDGRAWRAFAAVVRDKGIKAFVNGKDQRKLGLGVAPARLFSPPIFGVRGRQGLAPAGASGDIPALRAR